MQKSLDLPPLILFNNDFEGKVNFNNSHVKYSHPSTLKFLPYPIGNSKIRLRVINLEDRFDKNASTHKIDLLAYANSLFKAQILNIDWHEPQVKSYQSVYIQIDQLIQNLIKP